MRKSKILWYILLGYGCFYIMYFCLKTAASKNSLLYWIFIIVPIVIVFLVIKINKRIINNKYNKIKTVSEKYKLLCELNNKYTFNDIGTTKRVVIENEYSHKGYDRARAVNILLYQIENNEDNIREFILNAYRNKKIYDNYLNDYNNINKETSEEAINSIGMSKKEFVKLEKELLEINKIQDDIYNISIDVRVRYETPAGKYRYDKNRVVDYQELCDLYMQWRNGKKYDETSKRERKYMTNEMRYDVLKRDNFTCQKCGATAKDGAKLQVDHIVPVYKGGKTTMSNLQTLCDRCNNGKGTKNN